MIPIIIIQVPSVVNNNSLFNTDRGLTFVNNLREAQDLAAIFPAIALEVYSKVKVVSGSTVTYEKGELLGGTQKPLGIHPNFIKFYRNHQNVDYGYMRGSLSFENNLSLRQYNEVYNAADLQLLMSKANLFITECGASTDILECFNTASQQSLIDEL